MNVIRKIRTCGFMFLALFSIVSCVDNQIVTVKIPSSHSALEWMGRRFVQDDTTTILSYPGVSVKMCYQGDSLCAYFDQPQFVQEWGKCCFYVVLDEKDTVKLQLDDRTCYLLSPGNGLNEKHTVELIKLNEAQVGNVQFHGFSFVGLEGAVYDLNDLPQRRMEFIGNSITCGYGNEDSLNVPGFSSVDENVYWTAGAIVAREMNAQSCYIAGSGRGLCRSIEGGDLHLIPDVYDFSIETTHSESGDMYKWEHGDYEPHVIVLNLGTNDFNAKVNNGISLDSAAFVSAGVRFVEKLYRYHPKTTLICAVGPMLSDGYPEGEMALTRARSYVNRIVEESKRLGYIRTCFFEFTPQTAPYGRDWHPSRCTHRKMANQLKSFIESLPIDW